MSCEAYFGLAAFESEAPLTVQELVHRTVSEIGMGPDDVDVYLVRRIDDPARLGSLCTAPVVAFLPERSQQLSLGVFSTLFQQYSMLRDARPGERPAGLTIDLLREGFDLCRTLRDRYHTLRRLQASCLERLARVRARLEAQTRGPRTEFEARVVAHVTRHASPLARESALKLLREAQARDAEVENALERRFQRVAAIMNSL